MIVDKMVVGVDEYEWWGEEGGSVVSWLGLVEVSKGMVNEVGEFFVIVCVCVMEKLFLM